MKKIIGLIIILTSYQSFAQNIYDSIGIVKKENFPCKLIDDTTSYFCVSYELDINYSFNILLSREKKKKAEFFMLNGERNGIYKEWYTDNGQLKVYYNTLLGAIVGPYLEWHKNGKLKLQKKFPFPNTTKLKYQTDSIITTTAEDFSIVISEVTHKGLLEDGEIISYYLSGKKEYKGSYKNGNKDGEWVFWDKEGKVVKKEYYDKGYIINSNIIFKD